MGAGKRLNGRAKKLGEEKSRKKVGAPPTFFLDFSSPDFFARPFSLFPATTKCPWVSEDVVQYTQKTNELTGQVLNLQYFKGIPFKF